MNLGLDEVRGAVLVISQFTLYGDAAKGRRPSFIDAARPETAIPLYERFLAALRVARPRGRDRRVRRRHAGGDPQRRTRHPHPGPRMSVETETLTLASSSPRRRQLLEMLGIPVRVVPPNIPEVRRPVETPVDYVERLAREKALGVPGRLVLGADTTVVVRDEMLEKPVDAEDALRMLQEAAGPHPPGGHLGGAGGRRDDPSGHRCHQRDLPPAGRVPFSRPTSRPASRWTRPAPTAFRATAPRWSSGSTAISSA